MKKLLLTMLVLALVLAGCGSTATQLDALTLEEAASVPNEQKYDDDVLEVMAIVDAITFESSREEYEKARQAYESIRNPASRGLYEYKHKLNEIKASIEERENREAAAAFEDIVNALPDDTKSARESFDEILSIWNEMRRSQRELVSDEIKEKCNIINADIQRIEREEALENTIVVISATGSKYHEPNCHTLQLDGSYVAASRAIALGFESCNICKPISSSTMTFTYVRFR